MSRDCYFYIDTQVPEEERTISPLCVECREEHYPQIGWLWEAENGFGEWLYQCRVCGCVIHDPKEENG